MNGKMYQKQNNALVDITPSIVALRPYDLMGMKYFRSALPVPNKTTITVKAPLLVEIGDDIYSLGTDKTVALSSVGAPATLAGQDVYIYACQPASATSRQCDIVLSLSSTVPSGYNANNSRKIGGFHCLCASVGTISGHALSGYVAGDILPASVWDLRHRAKSENEGMVYVEPIDRWVDIYLASWNGSKLVSAYGAEVADGASTKKFHGELFNERFADVKKYNIRRDEFVIAANGSNERTAIKGAADAGTTGGHQDTANRRMISNYGNEDMCGFMWQWNEVSGSTHLGFNTSGASFGSTAGWGALPPYNHDSNSGNGVYASAVDSASRGDDYGVLYRLLAGGNWGGSSSCGPRSVALDDVSAGVRAGHGGRGASEPRSTVL